MDPKLSQLDPKLRDAYNRVLNGQTAQNTQSPSPAQPAQAPTGGTIQPQTSPLVDHNPIQPQPEPQMQMPSPIQAPQQTPAPVQAGAIPQGPQVVVATQPQQAGQTPPPVQNLGGTVAFNANGATNTTVVKKGTGKIKHILLAIGVIIALLVYTYMWIWIFKIKLPFLPT